MNNQKANRISRRALQAFAFLVCACLLSSTAVAQYKNEVPEAGKELEVREAECIGKFIPDDITFYDEYNNVTTLGDFLNNGRPIMLSFNYSNCPKLCSTQLSNMVYSLKDMNLVPGRDFEIVSISIDPTEQSKRAFDTKEKYVTLYGRPETSNGWHFLTGKQANIRKQADSVGVSYRYIPESRSFSHSAVFIMISPKGKIVRYIYGLEVEPKVLELALTEAGEGKIGSPINKGFLLTGCFVYDQFTGQYTMQWMGLMRIAGALTAYGVFIWLVPAWLRWIALYATGILGWLGFALLYLLSGDFFMFVMVSFVGTPFFVFATVVLAMKIKNDKTQKLNIDQPEDSMAGKLNLATSGERDA